MTFIKTKTKYSCISLVALLHLASTRAATSLQCPTKLNIFHIYMKLYRHARIQFFLENLMKAINLQIGSTAKTKVWHMSQSAGCITDDWATASIWICFIRKTLRPVACYWTELKEIWAHQQKCAFKTRSALKGRPEQAREGAYSLFFSNSLIEMQYKNTSPAYNSQDNGKKKSQRCWTWIFSVTKPANCFLLQNSFPNI